MKRYIILSIVCIFYITAHSQGKKYEKIFESFKNMPNEKLVTVADNYFNKDILDSALICFTILCKNYDIKSSMEDKKIFAHSYNRSGNIHYLMYNYVRAQEMYLKSLEICEESNYNEYIFKVYNNLGNIYASFSDFSTAQSYYKKALEKSIEYHDTDNTLLILDNLIGTSSNMGDTKKTQQYINMSDSINPSKGTGFIGITARGTIALDNGDFKTAVFYAKKAYHLADSLKMNPQFKCAALNNLATSFVRMQQKDSAKHYLFKSEKIAKANGLLDMQSFIYNELSDIAYNNGDKKQMLYYSGLYKIIEDSILSNRGYQSIKDVEFLFEMNRLDKQITTMKTEQAIKDAQLSQQRLIIFVVSSILLLIAVFSFINYRQKRKLQISYKDIFNKNIEIIASEKQAKQRYLKYERELREKDEYIIRIEHNRQLPEPEQETGTLNTNAGKYQNSSLNDKQRTALINSINDIMENTLEFCNAEFTLEKMAELVDSKSKYVSQVINETYGKNFNRYINEYRIKEARRRLTNINEYGQYTLKAVSQSVGFKSSSNFNLLFKEITGITPSMYQNMILDSSHGNLSILP